MFLRTAITAVLGLLVHILVFGCLAIENDTDAPSSPGSSASPLSSSWGTTSSQAGLSMSSQVSFSPSASSAIPISSSFSQASSTAISIASSTMSSSASAASSETSSESPSSSAGSVSSMVSSSTGTGTAPTGIYIADTANNRILYMNDMTGAGLTEKTGYNLPYSLAVGPDNRIYIADTGNNRIVRINSINGSGEVFFGGYGSGINQFNNPQGIAIGYDGKIYIADSGNNRIVRLDDINGTGWTTYGSYGTGTGYFSGPVDIAVNSSGFIMLSDRGNKRVIRINDILGNGWKEYYEGKEVFGVHLFNDSSACFVCRSSPAGSDYLRRLDSNFAPTTFYGAFLNVVGLHINSTGTEFYMAESGNNTIRKTSFSTILATYNTGLNTPMDVFFNE